MFNLGKKSLMCSITLFTIEPPPNTCMLHTRWGCQHPPHVHITYMVRGATPSHTHAYVTYGGGVTSRMYILHTWWGVTPTHVHVTHTVGCSPSHICIHYIYSGGYHPPPHVHITYTEGVTPTHMYTLHSWGLSHVHITCTRVSPLHTHMYILHKRGLSPPTHICIYYINGGRHPTHTHMYTLHTQGCHRHTRNLCTHYIDGGGAEWSQRQGEQP